MTNISHQVQNSIDALVDSGHERGLQVCAYRGGEVLVDCVAGLADPATGRPVTPDTPFYNFSIGKGAASTVIHVLTERGVLSYDMRVADVWPEFAAHGKGAVTLRQVLTHTAGVPGLPLDTTIDDVCTWDRICSVIADSELWWEPGTKTGYHAYTFGYLVGEVARRATGRGIADLLRDEVAAPLGVQGELWFSMPPAEHARLAVLEDAPTDPDAPDWTADLPNDLPMFRAGPMDLMPTAALGNDPRMLGADIPAGGKTSARAMARMYAGLLGNLDGVTFVSPDRLRELSRVHFSGPDQVFGNEASWALGYAVGGLGTWGAAPGETSTVIGMGGAGGGFAGGDTANGLTIAVTKNVVSDDFETATTLVELIAASG